MVGFGSAQLVLADATMPMAFAKVGEADAFIGALGGRAHLMRDVLDDLRRNVGRFPNIQRLLDHYEEPAAAATQIHDLDPADLHAVDDLVRLYQTPGDQDHKNRGEIATVLGAKRLRDAGTEVLVGMDDQLGKKLCRLARLEHADTPALLIELVCGRILRYRVAAEVWRLGLFPDSPDNWSGFEERLRASCPQMTDRT